MSGTIFLVRDADGREVEYTWADVQQIHTDYTRLVDVFARNGIDVALVLRLDSEARDATAENARLRNQVSELQVDLESWQRVLRNAQARAIAWYHRCDELRTGLKQARVDVEHWAAYAGDYFKEKWDLAGNLARLDAIIAGNAPPKESKHDE